MLAELSLGLNWIKSSRDVAELNAPAGRGSHGPDGSPAGGRRLPPRDLVVCRCVRKAWRAIVDASGLLLPHVVPLTLRGLFLNYSNRTSPRFARPASMQQPAVDGDLGFLPHYGSGSRRIVC
uniref:F-box domain-containing protein n=1 Tax=Aegilops tauschii TaxID=37682 RepID=R7W846_AEGTA